MTSLFDLARCTIHHHLRFVLTSAAVTILLATSAARSAQAGNLHGRVIGRNEDGNFVGLVGGATIEFRSRTGQLAARTQSSPHGYYRVRLYPGAYKYTVRAEGYKRAGRDVNVKHLDGAKVYHLTLTQGKDESDPTPYEEETARIGLLRGQVRERTDNGEVGIPRAVITLKRDGTAKPIQVVSSSGDASRENVGYFEVVLEEGSWRASVQAAGFERSVDPNRIVIVAGKKSNRDFELKRRTLTPAGEQGIEIHVSYREGSGQQTRPSLDAVQVAVVRIPGGRQVGEPQAPDTRGDLKRDLHTGLYGVTARVQGYRIASKKAFVRANHYTPVNLELRPLENGESEQGKYDVQVNVVDLGHVLSPSGAKVPVYTPIEDALVRVVRRQEVLTRRSDSDGEADFACRPGLWKAHAAKRGYETTEPVAANVRPGQLNHVRIVLKKPEEPAEQPQTLTVVVYDAKTTKSLVADVRFNRQDVAEEAAVRRTNDEGELQVTCEGEGPYTLVVKCEGYRTHTQALTVGPRDELVRVPMEPIPGGTILVTVTDSSKGPIRGAMVLTRYDGDQSVSEILREMTDSEGRAEFSVEKAGDYAVAAKFDKQPASGKQIHLDAGKTVKVHIQLANPTPPPADWGDVLIQVVERRQQTAVPDAVVYVHTPEQPKDPSGKPDRTDGQGFGRVRTKPGKHTVTAKATGYEISSTSISVTPGGETKVTLYAKKIPDQLVTDTRVSVQGFVVRKDPKSRTGYFGISQTRLLWKRTDAGNTRSTTSESRGQYSLTLEPGAYQVTVVPPAESGFERVVEENVRVARDMAAKYFILERKEQPERVRTRTLTVGALTQSGRGIHATITVRRGDEAVQRSTDSSGYCRLQLPPGTYSIKASAEGYGPGGTTATLSSSDVTRVIRLTETRRSDPVRTCTVTIEVRDARSGARINADNVTLEQSGRRGSAERYGDGHRVTVPQGNYVFRGYAKGYTVEPSKRSIRQSQTVTLRAQPDERIPPELVTLTVRTYQTRGSQRIPVRATVQVTGRAGTARGTTDGNGEFRTSLRPGIYRVTASASDFETASKTLSVGSRNVSTQIQLVGGDPDGGGGTQGGRPTLTVRTYQTQGSQQLPVRATINVMRGRTRVGGGTTDGNGYLRTSLPQGTYRVTASASGFVTASKTVSVGSRDVTTQIRLVRRGPGGGSGGGNGGRQQTHTLTVRAYLPRGSQQMPVRATIDVIRDGSQVASGTTDAKGYFRTSLPPGSYRVTANSGYATGSTTVSVKSRDATAQIPLVGAGPG